MAFRRGLEFTWKPIARINEDSVSYLDDSKGGGSPTPPPPNNNFLLLNGSPFLLLNGNNLALL